MIEKLKKEFSAINEAFFDNESGIKFLRIEVDLTDINSVSMLSRKISDWLDEQKIEDQYYLEVYSSGAEKEIEVDQLSNYQNENIRIELNSQIKDKNDFIGVLINTEPITIRWNAKGQMRNQIIEKNNISKISIHVKAGK